MGIVMDRRYSRKLHEITEALLVDVRLSTSDVGLLLDTSMLEEEDKEWIFELVKEQLEETK